MGKIKALMVFFKTYLVEVSAFFALMMMLVVVSLYFGKFHGELSGSRAVWGQFGDFVGGSLNPLFGFVSILILVSTLSLQRIELRESRKTAENNNEILALQLKAMGLQAKENTFFRLLEELKSDDMFKRFKAEGVPRRVFYAVIGIHRNGVESLAQKGFSSKREYFKELTAGDVGIGEFTQVLVEKFLMLVHISKGFDNSNMHQALIQSTFGPFLLSAMTHSMYYASKPRYETLIGMKRMFNGLDSRLIYDDSIAEDNLSKDGLNRYLSSKDENFKFINRVIDNMEEKLGKGRSEEDSKEDVVDDN